QKAGHIHYERSEPNVWYIQGLLVYPEHRNKSDKRVGFKLFSHCLKTICAKNPQRIYWYVSGTEKDSPDLEVLNQIYLQMISKLTFLPPYQLIKDDYETITYMSLEFDKGNQ